jgi:gas vesicle protein
MSEALIGVVIGGIIASVTPIITIISNHKKWKKEQKIEYLKQKRDRLEKTFKKSYQKILEGYEKDSFSMDAISDFMITLPKKVSEKFDEFMNFECDKLDPEKKKLEEKFKLLDISVLMKKELVKIDESIEKEINK